MHVPDLTRRTTAQVSVAAAQKNRDDSVMTSVVTFASVAAALHWALRSVDMLRTALTSAVLVVSSQRHPHLQYVLVLMIRLKRIVLPPAQSSQTLRAARPTTWRQLSRCACFCWRVVS